MKLHIRFYRSLFSAKAISNFRLFGVGSTIIYVLSLTFLCILPVLLVFLFNPSSPEDKPLQNSQKYGLEPSQMQEFASSVDAVLPFIIIVIYIAMYILFSGILFSGTSILSGLGLFLSKALNKKLSYRHLWVMSCYSITLPVVLLTIVFVLNVHVSHSFFLFWILTFIIFATAIYKSPPKNKKRL
ncbi:DUF1189 family protein [Fictibacillus phosphorivorans]|uniref:DUF1189 family protein n=1 Tax=Fictibacillus phosphorivorans TaxID=1221500 RepID=UPI0020415131|nr:DUF1189 family protein [Fictibacillus phosphorivorans]MCM3716831.1 DUF1189 domain-containing protein [Fictibacillus phosphorivorans]MCM3774620.1 DUF1189 domain-containing protein [Fictibacillus phosphorivorans]